MMLRANGQTLEEKATEKCTVSGSRFMASRLSNEDT
jgi:hypothetical protein